MSIISTTSTENKIGQQFRTNLLDLRPMMLATYVLTCLNIREVNSDILISIKSTLLMVEPESMHQLMDNNSFVITPTAN